MSKKYNAIYIKKKRKYGNCKNLHLKYITNSNYYNFFKLLKLIYIFKILYYMPFFGSAWF